MPVYDEPFIILPFSEIIGEINASIMEYDTRIYLFRRKFRHMYINDSQTYFQHHRQNR